ncbi:DUF6973 domain-containing protein [Flocculibacter collagenilyticus]|uniref:DUF6973 domain-containing protein n=1 Tax=Flocculibacter collagenilyticus TaxID=2744479 RepID=UPI0018F52118|nr:hypothetical protein [Flocculibacter collagenilyticus]
MSSTYNQYNMLTAQEKSYLGRHPHHGFAINEAKKVAYRETKKLFGVNGRNDKSDAFRHCFWTAMLARDLGVQNARQFTTAHESGPRNPPKEKAMDLHNNSVGLRIGRSGGGNASLSNRCFAALQAGELKVIK